mmetsp:Transcript_19283/g.27596  ORF Transcript_19283/g.27596 Transcript_19283/m.27596 type:complete len:242 (+) Transcript_19283:2-727(+)
MDSFDISDFPTASLHANRENTSHVSATERINGHPMNERADLIHAENNSKFVQPAAILQREEDKHIAKPPQPLPPKVPSINFGTENDITELKKQITGLKMQADALRKNNITLASDITSLHHHLKGKDGEIHALQSLLSQKNENIDSLNYSIEELQVMSEKKIAELEDKLEESATTMQYLKKCVVKYIATTDLSEKRRLYPVISQILMMDNDEKKLIEQSMASTSSLPIDSGALKSFWNDLSK